MIDAGDALRMYLLAQATLTSVVGDRLWVERFEPPPGYKPAQGPGICFRSRGGPGVDYSGRILAMSWQIKVYGVNEVAANSAYRALVDVLHDAESATILGAQLEIPGQTLTETDTGWPYVLCFFTTRMLSGLPV